jgi:hypothetical protein
VQNALIEQQKEVLRCTAGLTDWLERDARDWRSGLRDMSARIDRICGPPARIPVHPRSRSSNDGHRAPRIVDVGHRSRSRSSSRSAPLSSSPPKLHSGKENTCPLPYHAARRPRFTQSGAELRRNGVPPVPSRLRSPNRHDFVAIM